MSQSELTVTLPDGSKRTYPAGTTGAQVAESIGKGLFKAALAVKMNGELWDLNRPLPHDCNLAILTSKDLDGLEILRHDGAHIMAQAVKELFPKTQVTIGPVIEDGFYYDFLPENPFTPEDLVKIEKRMHEIVDRNLEITREEWDRNQAIQFFKDLGEVFKAEIIASIPQTDTITLYRQGDFIDLCRGPHLPSTGKLGHGFKVMKLAGAYWRGDSNNPMLQRIYGTAWANEKDLKAYLTRLEEAAKRDHRKLGKEMDLFHFQEESPGSVFWHPKGWDLFQNLIAYMRRIQNKAGFQEVNAPDMMDRSLWEASGHWEKFGENMFSLESPDEKRTYALKPMNCPGHVQIFKQGITSYRDLPIRLAEFGKVHRYEPSGALHGLMRVRSFTQDDAHIFCREDQITEESKKVCELILNLYKDFGFEDIDIKFADRPEKRVGSDEVWDHAETALKNACSSMGLEYSLNPGEGAFYGPKLEFVLKDAIGRHWQVGTLQVDLNLPARLGATYIDEKSDKVHPVMLHRAMFGSIERFTGILIEHYAGKLPLWLSPTQVVVNTIISDVDSYALEIKDKLRSLGIKVETDLRNEKISYKVREHFHAKVPALFILGKREADERKVAIRRLGSTDNTVLPLEEAIQTLVAEAKPPR